MIIDEETRRLRNKQIAKDRIAAKRDSWRIKRHANKILSRLREEYISTGKTSDIEILACSYPRMDMDKVMERLVDMKFITYTQRGDAYIVDFVMPEAEKPNTTKPPKAEPVKKESAKPPKPKIDDVEPKIEDIWPD